MGDFTSGSNPPNTFPALDAANLGQDQVVPQNITSKFREAFESYTPGVRWTENKASGDIITLDGNALAASYLVISKNPLTPNTISSIECNSVFDMPVELAIGASMSQRVLGQEFSIELIDTDEPTTKPDDLVISSISQTTTTLTVNTALPHNLVPGKRIGIVGVNDSRLNYSSLVVAGVVSPTQFTVSAGPGGTIPSVTAGPYTTGLVYSRSSMGYAQNGTVMVLEGASATVASIYVRAEAGDALPSGTVNGNQTLTVGTTNSVAAQASAYTYAFQPATEYRLVLQADRLQWSDASVDTLSPATARSTRTQVIPSIAKKYKFRIRGTNTPAMTVPVAKIVGISKAASATATVTTDLPHGLTTSDQIILYGVRDQTNFPNLASSAAVASVISPTQFTVALGSSATASSAGGFIARAQGGNVSIGALSQSIQSAQVVTGGYLQLTAGVAWSGGAVGDYVNVHGLRTTAGADMGLDGAYRIRNINTTTFVMELEALPGTPTPAVMASTNGGGAIIKRTDLRISYVRIFDYERQRVEIRTAANGDAGGSVSVSVNGTVSANQGTRAAQGSGWYQQPDNVLVNDVTSAALTATATTSTITAGTAGGAAEFNIPVTAVTGTNPTLDVGIEESDDTATNWYRIYDFPRITGPGIYRSPVLPLSGNRLRYVQTVGGTTPSFTRAINRITHLEYSPPPLRQVIDRAVNVNAANSTTATLKTNGASNYQLVLNLGAATTPPQLQIEGSDDNGQTYYAIGAPLVGVANSTVQLTVNKIHAELVRARVSTVGSAATLGWVLLKAFGL